MPTEGLKARHGIVLRAPSGALAVADRPLPLFDLEGHRRAIVHIMHEANLATPDADDRVRFHLETAYGAGAFVDSTANLNDNPLAGGQVSNIFPNQLDVVHTSDGTQFVVGDVIRVDNERMLVTEINPDGLGADFVRVRRGWDGDSVAQHVLATNIFRQDVDWIEIAQITYTDADDGTAPEALVVLGSTDVSPIILDDVDEALADNTILAAPLGDRLRLRVSIAGATAPAYNYSARASLQN